MEYIRDLVVLKSIVIDGETIDARKSILGNARVYRITISKGYDFKEISRCERESDLLEEWYKACERRVNLNAAEQLSFFKG